MQLNGSYDLSIGDDTITVDISSTVKPTHPKPTIFEVCTKTDLCEFVIPTESQFILVNYSDDLLTKVDAFIVKRDLLLALIEDSPTEHVVLENFGMLEGTNSLIKFDTLDMYNNLASLPMWLPHTTKGVTLLENKTNIRDARTFKLNM